MGEIQIPDDGFWGPIYWTMYLGSGVKPPQAVSGELYALAVHEQGLAPAIQQQAANVQGLAGQVLANVQGETATAFASHTENLLAELPAYVTIALNMAKALHAFGLNAEEAEYEILLALNQLAWEIYSVLNSPWAAVAVPTILVAGMLSIRQIILVSKMTATKITQSARAANGIGHVAAAEKAVVNGAKGGGKEVGEKSLAQTTVLNVADEGAEEGVQSTAPQVVTQSNDNREGGFDGEKIGISVAVGGLVGANHTLLHHGAMKNVHTANAVKTAPGAAVVGIVAEAPVEMSLTAGMGGDIDLISSLGSTAVTDGGIQALRNAVGDQKGQTPEGTGAKTLPPPTSAPKPHLPSALAGSPESDQEGLSSNGPESTLPGFESSPVPPQDGLAPPPGGLAPSPEGLAPPPEGLVPPSQGAPPEGLAPEGLAPLPEGLVPAPGGLSQEGLVPLSEGLALPPEGLSQEGLVPLSEGLALPPEGLPQEGLVPLSEGLAPPPQGLPSEGLVPPPQGSLPEGLSPEGLALPPQSLPPEGLVPAPEGLPQEGLVPPPQGLAPLPQGLPSEGLLPEGLVSPPQGSSPEGLALPSEGLASLPEELVSSPEGLVPTEGLVPRPDGVVPLGGGVVPPLDGLAPPGGGFVQPGGVTPPGGPVPPGAVNPQPFAESSSLGGGPVVDPASSSKVAEPDFDFEVSAPRQWNDNDSAYGTDDGQDLEVVRPDGTPGGKDIGQWLAGVSSDQPANQNLTAGGTAKTSQDNENLVAALDLVLDELPETRAELRDRVDNLVDDVLSDDTGVLTQDQVREVLTQVGTAVGHGQDPFTTIDYRPDEPVATRLAALSRVEPVSRAVPLVRSREDFATAEEARKFAEWRIPNLRGVNADQFEKDAPSGRYRVNCLNAAKAGHDTHTAGVVHEAEPATGKQARSLLEKHFKRSFEDVADRAVIDHYMTFKPASEAYGHVRVAGPDGGGHIVSVLRDEDGTVLYVDWQAGGMASGTKTPGLKFQPVGAPVAGLDPAAELDYVAGPSEDLQPFRDLLATLPPDDDNDVVAEIRRQLNSAITDGPRAGHASLRAAGALHRRINPGDTSVRDTVNQRHRPDVANHALGWARAVLRPLDLPADTVDGWLTNHLYEQVVAAVALDRAADMTAKPAESLAGTAEVRIALSSFYEEYVDPESRRLAAEEDPRWHWELRRTTEPEHWLRRAEAMLNVPADGLDEREHRALSDAAHLVAWRAAQPQQGLVTSSTAAELATTLRNELTRAFADNAAEEYVAGLQSRRIEADQAWQALNDRHAEARRWRDEAEGLLDIPVDGLTVAEADLREQMVDVVAAHLLRKDEVRVLTHLFAKAYAATRDSNNVTADPWRPAELQGKGEPSHELKVLGTTVSYLSHQGGLTGLETALVTRAARSLLREDTDPPRQVLAQARTLLESTEAYQDLDSTQLTRHDKEDFGVLAGVLAWQILTEPTGEKPTAPAQVAHDLRRRFSDLPRRFNPPSHSIEAQHLMFRARPLGATRTTTVASTTTSTSTSPSPRYHAPDELAEADRRWRVELDAGKAYLGRVDDEVRTMFDEAAALLDSRPAPLPGWRGPAPAHQSRQWLWMTAAVAHQARTDPAGSTAANLAAEMRAAFERRRTAPARDQMWLDLQDRFETVLVESRKALVDATPAEAELARVLAIAMLGPMPAVAPAVGPSAEHFATAYQNLVDVVASHLVAENADPMSPEVARQAWRSTNELRLAVDRMFGQTLVGQLPAGGVFSASETVAVQRHAAVTDPDLFHRAIDAYKTFWREDFADSEDRRQALADARRTAARRRASARDVVGGPLPWGHAGRDALAERIVAGSREILRKAQGPGNRSAVRDSHRRFVAEARHNWRSLRIAELSGAELDNAVAQATAAMKADWNNVLAGGRRETAGRLLGALPPLGHPGRDGLVELLGETHELVSAHGTGSDRDRFVAEARRLWDEHKIAELSGIDLDDAVVRAEAALRTHRLAALAADVSGMYREAAESLLGELPPLGHPGRDWLLDVIADTRELLAADDSGPDVDQFDGAVWRLWTNHDVAGLSGPALDNAVDRMYSALVADRRVRKHVKVALDSDNRNVVVRRRKAMRVLGELPPPGNLRRDLAVELIGVLHTWVPSESFADSVRELWAKSGADTFSTDLREMKSDWAEEFVAREKEVANTSDNAANEDSARSILEELRPAAGDDERRLYLAIGATWLALPEETRDEFGNVAADAWDAFDLARTPEQLAETVRQVREQLLNNDLLVENAEKQVNEAKAEGIAEELLDVRRPEISSTEGEWSTSAEAQELYDQAVALLADDFLAGNDTERTRTDLRDGTFTDTRQRVPGLLELLNWRRPDPEDIGARGYPPDDVPLYFDRGTWAPAPDADAQPPAFHPDLAQAVAPWADVLALERTSPPLPRIDPRTNAEASNGNGKEGESGKAGGNGKAGESGKEGESGKAGENKEEDENEKRERLWQEGMAVALDELGPPPSETSGWFPVHRRMAGAVANAYMRERSFWAKHPNDKELPGDVILPKALAARLWMSIGPSVPYEDLATVATPPWVNAVRQFADDLGALPKETRDKWRNKVLSELSARTGRDARDLGSRFQPARTVVDALAFQAYLARNSADPFEPARRFAKAARELGLAGRLATLTSLRDEAETALNDLFTVLSGQTELEQAAGELLDSLPPVGGPVPAGDTRLAEQVLGSRPSAVRPDWRSLFDRMAMAVGSVAGKKASRDLAMEIWTAIAPYTPKEPAEVAATRPWLTALSWQSQQFDDVDPDEASTWRALVWDQVVARTGLDPTLPDRSAEVELLVDAFACQAYMAEETADPFAGVRRYAAAARERGVVDQIMARAPQPRTAADSAQVRGWVDGILRAMTHVRTDLGHAAARWAAVLEADHGTVPAEYVALAERFLGGRPEPGNAERDAVYERMAPALAHAGHVAAVAAERAVAEQFVRDATAGGEPRAIVSALRWHASENSEQRDGEGERWRELLITHTGLDHAVFESPPPAVAQAVNALAHVAYQGRNSADPWLGVGRLTRAALDSGAVDAWVAANRATTDEQVADAADGVRQLFVALAVPESWRAGDTAADPVVRAAEKTARRRAAEAAAVRAIEDLGTQLWTTIGPAWPAESQEHTARRPWAATVGVLAGQLTDPSAPDPSVADADRSRTRVLGWVVPDVRLSAAELERARPAYHAVLDVLARLAHLDRNHTQPMTRVAAFAAAVLRPEVVGLPRAPVPTPGDSAHAALDRLFDEAVRPARFAAEYDLSTEAGMRYRVWEAERELKALDLPEQHKVHDRTTSLLMNQGSWSDMPARAQMVAKRIVGHELLRAARRDNVAVDSPDLDVFQARLVADELAWRLAPPAPAGVTTGAALAAAGPVTSEDQRRLDARFPYARFINQGNHRRAENGEEGFDGHRTNCLPAVVQFFNTIAFEHTLSGIDVADLEDGRVAFPFAAPPTEPLDPYQVFDIPREKYRSHQSLAEIEAHMLTRPPGTFGVIHMEVVGQRELHSIAVYRHHEDGAVEFLDPQKWAEVKDSSIRKLYFAEVPRPARSPDDPTRPGVAEPYPLPTRPPVDVAAGMAPDESAEDGMDRGRRVAGGSALHQRPDVVGDPNLRPVRDKIVDKLGGSAGARKWATENFSDKHLKELAKTGSERQVYAGAHFEVLVELVTRGESVGGTAAMSDHRNVHEGSTVATSAQSEQQREGFNYSRLLQVPLTAAQAASPVEFSLKVEGTTPKSFAAQRSSEEQRRSVEIIDRRPVTRAAHEVVYRVTVRDLRLEAHKRDKGTLVTVPMLLEWPRPAPVETGPFTFEMGYPTLPQGISKEERARIQREARRMLDSIKLAEFAEGFPDVVKQVRKRYKLAEDHGEIVKLKAWLRSIDGSQEGLSMVKANRQALKSFQFKGRHHKPVEVRLVLTDVTTAPDLAARAAEGGSKASVTRSRSRSHERTSSHGSIAETGVEATVKAGKEIADMLGFGLRMTVNHLRSNEDATELGHKYEQVLKEVVSGKTEPFVAKASLRVAFDDEPATVDDEHKIRVPATVLLRVAVPGEDDSEPPSLEQSTQLPPREAIGPAGVRVYEVPDLRHTRWQLTEKELQTQSAWVLNTLHADGEIEGHDLPRLTRDLEEFFANNMRVVLHGGDVVRFRLPNGKYLFFGGDVDRAAGTYVNKTERKKLSDRNVASLVSKVWAKRTRKWGLHLGIDVELPPVLLDAEAGPSFESERRADVHQTIQHVHEWASTGPSHIYRYPAIMTVRLGTDLANLGEPMKWKDESGRMRPHIETSVRIVVSERPGVPAKPDPAPVRLPEETSWLDPDDPAVAIPSTMRRAKWPVNADLESMVPDRELGTLVTKMLNPPQPGGVVEKGREGLRWILSGDRPPRIGEHHEGHEDQETSQDHIAQWASEQVRQQNLALAANSSDGPDPQTADTLEVETYNEANLIHGNRYLTGRATMSTTYFNRRIVQVDEHHVFTEGAGTQTNLPRERKKAGGADATIKITEQPVDFLDLRQQASASYQRGPARIEVDTVDTETTRTWVERGYLMEDDVREDLTTTVQEVRIVGTGHVHHGTAKVDAKARLVPGANKKWVPASQLVHEELSDHDINNNLADEDLRNYYARNSTDAPDVRSAPPPVPEWPQNVPQTVATFDPAGPDVVDELVGRLREQLRDYEASIGGKAEEKSRFAPGGRRARKNRAMFSTLHDGAMTKFGNALVGGGFHLVAGIEMPNGGFVLFVERTHGNGKFQELLVVQGELGEGEFARTVHDYGYSHKVTTTNSVAEGPHSTATAKVGANVKFNVPEIALPDAPGLAPVTGVVAEVQDALNPSAEAALKRASGPVATPRSRRVDTFSWHGEADQYQHSLTVRVVVVPWARSGNYLKLIPGLRAEPIKGVRVLPSFTMEHAVHSTVPAFFAVLLNQNPIDRATGSWRESRKDRGTQGFPDSVKLHAWPFQAAKAHAVVRAEAELQSAEEQEASDDREVNSYRVNQLLTGTGVAQLANEFRVTLSPGGYVVHVGGRTLSHLTLNADLLDRELLGPITDAELRGMVAYFDHTARLVTKDASFKAMPLSEAVNPWLGDLKFEKATSWSKQTPDAEQDAEEEGSPRQAYLVRAVLAWHIIAHYANLPDREHRTGEDGVVLFVTDEGGLRVLGLRPNRQRAVPHRGRNPRS